MAFSQNYFRRAQKLFRFSYTKGLEGGESGLYSESGKQEFLATNKVESKLDGEMLIADAEGQDCGLETMKIIQRIPESPLNLIPL